MATEQARCVLWGGYAGGNVGDELTLAVAVQDMQVCFGESIAILSRQPEVTRRSCPAARVIPFEPVPWPVAWRWFWRTASRLRRLRVLERWAREGYRAQDQFRSPAPPPWVEAIVNCQRLYLVGGGYLTDLWNVQYFLLPVLIGRRAGIPVATAPLGIGPFSSRRSEAAVAQALRGVEVVVRDEASLEFCRHHGIESWLRPDDGFRVREVAGELGRPQDARASADQRSGRPLIGVCFFPQHGADSTARAERWWAGLLAGLQRHRAHIEIEGFCFHSSEELDFATMARLFRETGWGAGRVQRPLADFRSSVRQLLRYDVVVAARFHAVVVGNALGVPTVAVASGPYYAAKMRAASRSFEDHCRVVSPDRDSPEAVAGHVADMCQKAVSLASGWPRGRP